MARLVGKADIDRTLAAKTSMQKEWGRRRSKSVRDEGQPREWDEVWVEARRVGGWGGGGVHRTYGLLVRPMR